jgi:hypothetical protein
VYRRPLAIDPPPHRISFLGSKAATVTVTIERRVSEMKFEKLPVEVVGIPKATVKPHKVDVTLTGPPETVRALRAEQVVPRADLSAQGIKIENQKHGSVTVKVTVDVANVEAQIQPPTVTVKW